MLQSYIIARTNEHMYICNWIEYENARTSYHEQHKRCNQERIPNNFYLK